MSSETPKETDDVSGPASALAEAHAHAHAHPHARAGHEPEDEELAGDSLPDEPDPSDDPDAKAEAPAAVAELAAACVRFVAGRYGVLPDFTSDTLSLVDQWLRDARAEVARRPETEELVHNAAGAYLGEVVRRAFGARWVIEGHASSWRLCLSTVYCAFNPVGMAREALEAASADGWHAHFELDPGEREGVEARLAALPTVRDEDYYAPSTRFDVVAIVHAALREAMRAQGLGEVRFTPKDYELG